MLNQSIMFGTIFLIAIVVIMVLFVGKKSEGFGSYNSFANDRNAYIAESKRRYNPLAEIANVNGPGFFSSVDPEKINSQLASALGTSDITNSEVQPSVPRLVISTHGMKKGKGKGGKTGGIGVFNTAKKCESLKSRDSCKLLDDPKYKDCGVCIKAGTPITYKNPNKHIGGMLLLPDDYNNAQTKASETNTSPKYLPSAGECPGGYFFASRTECEKQVNRLDCEESGKTGGFNGKTIEGKQIALKKCAQVLNAGDDVFIYDPKNRPFSVNLRALAPVGTGICKIWVYDSKKKPVGYAESKTPGKEFVVNVKNVKEQERLTVSIMMEAPYRYGFKRELYQVRLKNKVTAEESKKICERYASNQATKADLEKAAAQENNGQVCKAGWTADNFLGWPSQTLNAVCGAIGLNSSSDKTGETWCVGLKPPQSENMTSQETVQIPPWYESQGSKRTIQSKHGDNFINPFERAILLQWETASGKSDRKIAFESSVVAINGIGPSSTADGVNIFSSLKRFGTFANSSIIQTPTQKTGDKILGSNYWIWDNRPLSQQLQFTAVIPGIFLDSYYSEDRLISDVGMLVGNPKNSQMLKSSPCTKPGQKPGSYSLACLQNAFTAAGGDIQKGHLVTKNGGLTQLNTVGSLADIKKYLDNLNSIATTGKNKNGSTVGKSLSDRRNIINDAAKKMFGFEIASPCESITHNFKGSIVIAPKKGDEIDEKCLDYLWANTGTENEHGKNDSDRTVKNTYTHIGDRFSGLRNNEGDKELLKQHPFTLCQRAGTASPLSKTGQINKAAVAKAHKLGSIPEIQRYYDSIYNAANNKRISSSKQNEAVKQCYGVSKLPLKRAEGFVDFNKDKSAQRKPSPSSRSSGSSKASSRSSGSSKASSRSSGSSKASSRSSGSSKGSRSPRDLKSRKGSPKLLSEVLKKKKKTSPKSGKKPIKKTKTKTSSSKSKSSRGAKRVSKTPKKYSGENSKKTNCSKPNAPASCFQTQYSSPHVLSAAARNPNASTIHGKSPFSTGRKSRRRGSSRNNKGKSRKNSSRRNKSSRSSRSSKSSRSSRRSKSSRSSRRSNSSKSSRRSNSSKGSRNSKRSKSSKSSRSSKGSRSKSPKARGRSKSPKARGRSKSPKARGRSNSPKARGRSNSPKARGRSNSPKNNAPKKARPYGASIQNSKLGGSSY